MSVRIYFQSYVLFEFYMKQSCSLSRDGKSGLNLHYVQKWIMYIGISATYGPLIDKSIHPNLVTEFDASCSTRCASCCEPMQHLESADPVCLQSADTALLHTDSFVPGHPVLKISLATKPLISSWGQGSSPSLWIQLCSLQSRQLLTQTCIGPLQQETAARSSK